MNPPLFLRFLNLLMNDAIFLLDEAIQVCACNDLLFMYVLHMFNAAQMSDININITI